jgi:hypothetical protein
MDLREIGWEVLYWTHLAQDKDQWWALVNMVINLQIPWKAGNFFTSWVSISFLEGLCSMQLVTGIKLPMEIYQTWTWRMANETRKEYSNSYLMTINLK